MNLSPVAPPSVTVPPEVRGFAAAQGVGHYLDAVVELTQRAFPTAVLCVSTGQDAEDERHRYIALDVAVGDLTTEELLAGQRIWSTGIGSVCPSRDAVRFVLGWR